MEGGWGLFFLACFVGVGFMIWRLNRRKPVPGHPGDSLPAAPVEDPKIVAARKEMDEEALWEVQERDRAEAWRAWEERRDQEVAHLKLNPPAALFKIERGLDNIYRIKKWVCRPTKTPAHAFDHTNDALVAKAERRRRSGSSLRYMDENRNRDRENRRKHPWPHSTPTYSESWTAMNDLTFAFLQEAEQWLDDYLNPKGREWGYGAFGDKVSDGGEPAPVVPIESHFVPVQSYLTPQPQAVVEGWETAETARLPALTMLPGSDFDDDYIIEHHYQG